MCGRWPAIRCWMVRMTCWPPSEIRSLVAFGRLVGRACLLGALERGGLGHRYVPPALGGRDRRERIGFDIHNGGPVRRPGPLQAVPELRDGAGPYHVGTEAGR